MIPDGDHRVSQQPAACCKQVSLSGQPTMGSVFDLTSLPQAQQELAAERLLSQPMLIGNSRVLHLHPQPGLIRHLHDRKPTYVARSLE